MCPEHVQINLHRANSVSLLELVSFPVSFPVFHLGENLTSYRNRLNL